MFYAQSVEHLRWFIDERYAIFLRKEAGEPKPWTNDSILQQYRFCNVFREDDAVTRWAHNNWGRTYAGYRNLWFAMAAARIFNNPDCLADLGCPLPTYDPEKYLRVLRQREAMNKRRYGAAYMITATHKEIRSGEMTKDEFICRRVLGGIWGKTPPRDTLESFCWWLAAQEGFGSFLAAQVVADIKHFGEWRKAPDWWTFAASGPGSRRGLNRVCGRPVNAPWKEEEWKATLDELHEHIYEVGGRQLDAQNLQNCLCEFDKYERARLGEGRPKQRYN
ncbi:hypothetical protein D6833_09890, partial [Candidatus Parcubacteria bacterium]